MKLWIDTYIGTDVATYLSLAVGVVALFGAKKVYKVWKQKKIKQTVNKVHGNVYQAVGDINQTINNHISGESSDAEGLKNKSEHDLRIIEEILTLLPYEETTHCAGKSHQVGMLLQFSDALEHAEKYDGIKYRLYNPVVDMVKNNFIESVRNFNDSHSGYLSVDHIERKPVRLDLPYDWKNKGGEFEKKYYSHQKDMKEKAQIMIKLYDNFVKLIKEQEFITDKL